MAPTIAGIIFISLNFFKLTFKKTGEYDPVPSLYLDGKTNRNKSFGRSSIEVYSKSERHFRLNKG